MRDYKYQIGDVVRLVVSANQVGLKSHWGTSGHNEMRGQILTRYTEEDANGMEYIYGIRWVHCNGSYGISPAKHAEMELVLSSPFPSNAPEAKEKP